MERVVFEPVTFSSHDFKVFKLMIVAKLGIAGYKKGYRGIALDFPNTEEVQYPLYIDGIEVRAIHDLTSFEQNDILETVKICNTCIQQADQRLM